MSKWDSPPSHLRDEIRQIHSPDLAPVHELLTVKGIERDRRTGEEIGSNRGRATYSENGTAGDGCVAAGRRCAGFLLGISTESGVPRLPLDRPRGETTRTGSGRGLLPQTLRSRNTNHSMICACKACTKGMNSDTRLHCLNTISIEDPKLTSLRFLRRIPGYLTGSKLTYAHYAYRPLTAPTAIHYFPNNNKRIWPFAR